jgi:hypothetical protein
VIEVTHEMVTAFMQAAQATPVQVAGRELLNARAGLAAVLALVEADYCLERKGHVFHPLARSKPGRGVNHPHYCLSCSDGEAKGPGCMNCRQTGFDQTPWPQCAGCATPPQ